MQEASDEATDQVRSAYQWLLGRPADPAGLAAYAALIDRGELDAEGLRRTLLYSQEFQRSTVSPLSIVEIGHGVRVVVDPSEPEFGRHIAASGAWEPHIVATIRKNLEPGATFVDIGANVGLMSFHAADATGPDGKVIAFEPNPRNVRCFRRGIAANEFDNVLLYPFAVSDKFRILVTTTASNAKVEKDTDPLTMHDVGQAVPVDFMLRGEPRVDMIKIDIEGYELSAFKGMDETLKRHRPLVLAEFNPLCLKDHGGIKPEEMVDHIFSMTDIVESVEHDGSLTRIESGADLMDLWFIRDREATETGRLPAGWFIFDLLFRAYSSRCCSSEVTLL